MTDVYARPPEKRPELGECAFYHTIELPGLGVLAGQWDLRPGVDNYLGPTDFAGRRVLEIGTANGFVCFELEHRGADVVALDLPTGASYDVMPLPHARDLIEGQRHGVDATKKAYWLAHSLIGSRARVVYAHANSLPAEIGDFDVVVMGNVMQHLKDPVGAVIAAAQRARTVVVTEADWMSGYCDDLRGMIYFGVKNPFSWYQVKAPLLEAVLGDLGFAEVTVGRHEQYYLQNIDYAQGAQIIQYENAIRVPHFTVTASR